MKTNQSPVLVNTADLSTGIVTPIAYAKTKDGKIDLDAYKEKTGVIVENNLSINVKIVDARRRYGHLDLKVTPLDGSGYVWVERKNITINDDPAYAQKLSKIAAKHEENIVRHEAGHIDTMEHLRQLVATMVAEERANR